MDSPQAMALTRIEVALDKLLWEAPPPGALLRLAGAILESESPWPGTRAGALRLVDRIADQLNYPHSQRSYLFALLAAT
jgi:hypothetical protein